MGSVILLILCLSVLPRDSNTLAIAGSKSQHWWSSDHESCTFPLDHVCALSYLWYLVVLWSTRRLLTFMSTQRISWHVDIIFNISTKQEWKNKISIIMWEAVMSYATTFKWKNETSLSPKCHIITNREPNFIMYFQITLVLQCLSSAHFMLMSSPSALQHYSYWSPLWPNGTFPFMQHRSGNLVRIPKLERDFLDFWMEFYTGFYEQVNDRLMTNDYKQYFASSGVYFGLLFQTHFKSSRSV